MISTVDDIFILHQKRAGGAGEAGGAGVERKEVFKQGSTNVGSRKRKSIKNKTVEIDGIRFETLVPEREILIPTKDGAKTPVQFGISITNCTDIAYRFKFFGLMPELQDAKGTVIERTWGRNVTKVPQEDDFPLAMPNESLTFFVKGQLYCYQDKFGFSGDDSSGDIWTFRTLNPGRYQVRFTYENQNAVIKIYHGGTVEGLWTGKVFTPWEEFRLVY